MGVLSRLLDVSKAAINEALDKLEQPDMMLNYYVRNMQEELYALEQAAAREEAELKRLEKEIAYYGRMAEEHERKAGEAMADERMAEARQAIEAKLASSDRAEERKQAYEAAQRRAAEIAERLERAKSEFAAMKAKKEELAKRAEKLASNPHQTGSGYTKDVAGAGGSAALGFRRIEESIMQEEMKLEMANSAKAAADAAREARIEEQLAKLRGETQRQEHLEG
ncbi:PspA/IM30 family protein [Paenibacillus thermotolerans]|uniref:PspA/IM30 family protein n=1 Tax=Paenibacillus thermotolerans TaxID=3027807 RepID=UPI0023678FEA|nr:MULTISPECIES: PspA/IM30 family protein [unclassified Paenibacillus]